MPRISVIVDVMNRENLNFCLDSLILQKYPDFEAICAVFSKDIRVINLLKSYSKFDSRIKFLCLSGIDIYKARKKIIREAKGKYLYFVNSFDSLSLLTLNELKKTLESSNSDFVYSNIGYFKNNLSKGNVFDIGITSVNFQNIINNIGKNCAAKDVFASNPTTIYGKFYKSEFLKKIKFQNEKYYSDTPLLSETFLLADRISFEKIPYYFYKQRNSLFSDQNMFSVSKIIQERNFQQMIFKKFGKYETYKNVLLILKMEDCLKALLKSGNDDFEKNYVSLKNEFRDFDYLSFNQEKINSVKLIFDDLFQLQYPDFIEKYNSKLKGAYAKDFSNYSCL